MENKQESIKAIINHLVHNQSISKAMALSLQDAASNYSINVDNIKEVIKAIEYINITMKKEVISFDDNSYWLNNSDGTFDKLEKLCEEKFNVDMIDHWSEEDRKEYEMLVDKIYLEKKKIFHFWF